MTAMNRQILLVSRPSGRPTVDNFRLVQAPDFREFRWRSPVLKPESF
jgi:hypothetical protein